MKRTARLQGGFNAGKLKQGGWLAGALKVGLALFGASRSRKKAKQDAKYAKEAQAAKDPYGPYRAEAAKKLSSLSMDDVSNTAEYKARQTAASRLMASQGYTGSGNAVVAAAEAGGASYQQAFDNLARQAGVDIAPGGGYDTATQQQGSQQYLDNLSGAANSAMYGVNQILGAFNKKPGE